MPTFSVNSLKISSTPSRDATKNFHCLSQTYTQKKTKSGSLTNILQNIQHSKVQHNSKGKHLLEQINLFVSSHSKLF